LLIYDKEIIIERIVRQVATTKSSQFVALSLSLSLSLSFFCCKLEPRNEQQILKRHIMYEKKKRERKESLIKNIFAL
jgi:hypothetical protein